MIRLGSAFARSLCVASKNRFDAAVRREPQIGDRMHIDLVQASQGLSTYARDHRDGQRIQGCATVAGSDDDEPVRLVQV